MNNGLPYARIRSRDEKKGIKFLTVCANHERNWHNLRYHLSSRVHKEFKESFKDSKDFHRMSL